MKKKVLLIVIAVFMVAILFVSYIQINIHKNKIIKSDIETATEIKLPQNIRFVEGSYDKCSMENEYGCLLDVESAIILEEDEYTNFSKQFSQDKEWQAYSNYDHITTYRKEQILTKFGWENEKYEDYFKVTSTKMKHSLNFQYIIAFHDSENATYTVVIFLNMDSTEHRNIEI